MRLLRDDRDGVVLCYPLTTQHSSLGRAQQLWNEWEIQCLVLVSFSLQVFLLFSAGFRKRYNSRVLSALLWLAYLSADSVAVFLLGRLTLLVGDDPRHQLPLFWAPFLLLHLGGQETITAFSIEDNTLWMRHLLNLATQVALAIYIVGKQWRGDKQLVAPMALVFILGTAKYAERIWALKRASSMTTGSRIGAWLTKLPAYFQLSSIVLDGQAENFESVLEVATGNFEKMFNYFMDVTPSGYVQLVYSPETERAVTELKHSGTRVDTAYKLVEISLSLIYDALYTKFPIFYSNNIRFMGSVLHRLTTLGLTSVAVALFARAMADQNGRLIKYNGADVIISYILVVGATMLEIISIFLAFFSSYWAYKSIISFSLGCCVCQKFPVIGKMLLTIVRPESRRECSWKLPQHNIIISECIQARQEASSGLLQRTMRWIGIDEGAIARHGIYSEVKRPLLDKLLEIVATSSSQKWPDLTKFNGQWAQWAVERMQEHNGSAAQKALSVSNIEGLDPVGSAIVWHIATDICLWTDEATGGDEFRCLSRSLSNYIMYLVTKCKVIGGSQGQFEIDYCRDSVSSCLEEYRTTDQKEFIQKFREDTTDSFHDGCPELYRARNVSLELLRIEAAADRWKLIAMVWMEMLCYIAHNCAVGFHAKHLTTGGEFVSHVKVLLFILGIPFRLRRA